MVGISLEARFPVVHPNCDIRRIGKRKRISLREFLSYRIQDRCNQHTILCFARRLFQQFVVDAYSMIEAQRLSFIRQHQKNIRKDFLSGILEAVNRGDIDASTIGSRVVLPSSFVGGFHYMFNNCQDAMAICTRFGYPDLFLTITCNPKWPEIQRYLLLKGLNAFDRPDIICRLFHIKLQKIMEDFKKQHFFGKVIAVEFQKRGLPHAHILLWLDKNEKIDSIEKIDSVICAEFPDPHKYPKLFEIVSTFMVHGPCGNSTRNSPCMKNGKCSKYFPKKYTISTSIDADGFAIYKRRDTGVHIIRKGIELDNRFVVPYNPMLLMKYQAHINIKYCNKSNSIKYLFKYINKGVDRVTMSLSTCQTQTENSEPIDEIKQYYDCRYLSPCESMWRIFAFDIHMRWPPVQRLSFHLPNEQVVVFGDSERIDNVLARNLERKTLFTGWMDANIKYPAARTLTYSQFPESFVYNTDLQEWRPRKNGFSVGRLTYFPPGSGDLYYLRMLLNVQVGCTSFNDLKTVNGVVYGTFRDTCIALGLLSDDKEFVDGIKEASIFASGHYIRRLFVSLLLSNTMSNPSNVWEQTWNLLADGILYDKRRELNVPDINIHHDNLRNLCLLEVQKLMQFNGRSLKEFESMPFPNDYDANQYGNVLLFNELNFDMTEMDALFRDHFCKLNKDKKKVFNEVIDACNSLNGGFFFVYGFGGTGKTFLWKTLTYKLRSEKKIVLNVASSGIASLLLPGGKTAHSQFAIPLALNEDSCCAINQGSLKAELLQRCTLIIWDEAPMVNRFAFEALDRTLRDIMRFDVVDSFDKPFGGKVVVLGGDFRQILPVVPNATRAEIVLATINSSLLWKYCKILKLTENMRLKHGSGDCVQHDIQLFSDWILALGDGLLGDDNDGDSILEIPKSFIVNHLKDPIEDIVQSIYADLFLNIGNVEYFKDRAILAPTLEVISTVNDFVMAMFRGHERVYLSADSILKVDENIGIEADWLTTEFLNDIRLSGLPDHRLTLKKGVPVMLMRNLDISIGLCNGTRLIVEELGSNIIGATIVTGTNIGCKVYIPRLNLVPSDRMTPFKFQRRQFPLIVCFAMTINKSQGQSLAEVGVFLPRPVFTHGQLYVAFSRVKTKSGLKVLICDDNKNRLSCTKNIVYREVFQKI